MSDEGKNIVKTWGYNAKGESRIFDLPEGEKLPDGWTDSPHRREAKEAMTEVELLRTRASELGIAVDRRWSATKLQELIDDAERDDAGA